jgi:periplasmic copper chaperone A
LGPVGVFGNPDSVIRRSPPLVSAIGKRYTDFGLRILVGVFGNPYSVIRRSPPLVSAIGKRYTDFGLRVLGIGLLLFLIGCTVGGGSGPAEGELVVRDVWGRNAPAAAPNGAFYLTISNGTDQDEQLLGASAEVCQAVELHEMYLIEADVMGMREVPGGVILIPAGATVELKVGGLHMMCIEKTRAFELGEEIPLTLNFANAGEKMVLAQIREAALEGMNH